jgi:Tetratricopeptide repeat.
MEIGDYGKAINSLNRSLEISEEIGDRLGVARAELNIGEGYRQTGSWERAKEFFNSTIEKSIALRGYMGSRFRTDCYINLGDIYMLENRTDEAKGYYERALEEATDIGETQIIVRIYLGLAKMCIEQKSFYEALDHLDKAHIASSRTGSKRYKAETYALRGRVNEEQRRYREALQSYGLAIFLFREINNKYGIAHTEEAVGTIYAKIGNKERSLEYLRRAKEKYASFASIIDLENIDKKIREIQTL